MDKIKKVIQNADLDNVSKVNWTKVWGTKYQILDTYRDEIDVIRYSSKIRGLLDSLKSDYNYSELDSMLVLKDILYHEWKDKN